MIAADKNLLKANLQRGILTMQSRLIELYVANLQSIGTQAAFIASLGYVGIGEIRMPSTGYTWFGLNFFFDFCIHLSMILGVFVTTQSAVVSVYGPSVALKGAEANVVLMVADKMREQRKFVLRIGALTLVALLFAMMFNFWAKVPPAVCVSSTVLYLAGFVLCITEGVRCYNLFHPDKEVVITLHGIKNVNPMKTTRKTDAAAFKRVNSGGSTASVAGSGRSSQSEVGSKIGSVADASRLDDENRARHAALAQEAAIQARGRLWWRQSLDEGGELVERYAVLSKGLLDIFANEEEFKATKNPLNAKPFKLWQYALVTDYKKFPRNISSGLKAFRELVTGQGELGFLDLVTSDFDLAEAVKKYRFALVPKVYSELSPIPSAEFMAADQDDYRQWVKTFSRVIKAFQQLEELVRNDDGLTLSDATSVEKIVQAANI